LQDTLDKSACKSKDLKKSEVEKYKNVLDKVSTNQSKT